MEKGDITPLSRKSMRFLVTGSAVAALFFVLSFTFVSSGMPVFASHVSAYLIAFCVGYGAQRNWTFQGRSRHRRAFPRYLALQMGCMVGTGVLAYALAALGTPALYMSAITTGVAALMSYVVSSRWVFSEKPTGTPTSDPAETGHTDLRIEEQ